MIISDLHIHSKYSRATSKQISIDSLEKWARIKGINLLGTGDFTHPIWLEELKKNLKEDDTGFLKTKSGFQFVLTVEVSNMYRQDDKARKIHHVILAPNFEAVEQINEYLGKFGKLASDGRPIFGSFPSYRMIEGLIGGISRDIEIIPAHIWTPWFSVFGSKSGFDSLEECYKDQVKHIHALETGLSSDPPMNWQLSQLDKYNLVSFSDAHSFWPWRIGREATIFDLPKPTYSALLVALRTGKGLKSTIEVNPAYGKYHWDGHRSCGIQLNPETSKKYNNICPVCKRPLTIGVLNRVLELADRKLGYKPEGKPDYKDLIPLSELIATSLGTKQLYGKKVFELYHQLTKDSSEYDVLLYMAYDKLKERSNEKLANLIIASRENKIEINPGYDGVYGEPILKGREPTQIIPKKSQPSLLDF